MKSSLHAQVMIAAMRLTRRKQTFADIAKLHKSLEPRQRPADAEPPAKVRERVLVTKQEIHDRPVYTLRPRRGYSSRHVLYFHGGAYVHQIRKDHWSFLARLVTETGCTATAPLYPLAPNHRYTETLAVIKAVYKEKLSGLHSDDQILMGDSAGGGLALVLAQSLRDEGSPQPKEIVLLSPWLDINMSDPAQRELDKHDPYLGIAGLLEAGRLYAGELDPNHPLVSPLNGNLQGLGALSVFVGTREVLLSDARRLRAKAAAQDVRLEYREYENMFHAWMLASFPEAKMASARIADLITRGGHP